MYVVQVLKFTIAMRFVDNLYAQNMRIQQGTKQIRKSKRHGDL